MRIRFFSLLVIFNLCSCAHYADLRKETIGSIAGALAGGFGAGAETSNLIHLGVATTAGSVLGGIVGAGFDDMCRDKTCDPLAWTISLDCYDTYRPWPFYYYAPVALASYCPGIIMPPEPRDIYGRRAWHDPHLL